MTTTIPSDDTLRIDLGPPPAPRRAAFPPDRLVGSIVGLQYRIVEPIGHGGTATVYRAQQLNLNRQVAVKVLSDRCDLHGPAARRFEREASIISALKHPNTLRLFDCGRLADGRLFLVTEMLEGVPLSWLIRRTRGLRPRNAIWVAANVCRALTEAHEAGVIHRDLTPNNIFISRVGTEPIVKVLDFGLAKLTQGDLAISAAGQINGTPTYMAPEQIVGDAVDQRSDIYALATVLFQSIAGVPPFSGSVLCVLNEHLYSTPPALGGVSRTLADLIGRMLEKLPQRRPNTMERVRRALLDVPDAERWHEPDVFDGVIFDTDEVPAPPGSGADVTRDWTPDETTPPPPRDGWLRRRWRAMTASD